MSRRLVIGNDGTGKFILRQVAAGADALTAALNDRLFDADAIPGVVALTGSFEAKFSTTGLNPAAVNHGIGYMPSFLMCAATPIGGTWQAANKPTGGFQTSINLGNPYMDRAGSRSTAFGSNRYVTGVEQESHFRYTWDDTKIRVWINQDSIIYWTALDLPLSPN